MFIYEKRLEYPVNIKKRNLKFAKDLLTQLGGPNGELAASLRYLSQSFAMPDEKGKALLTDIASEELGHVEMISTMLKQLTEGATIEEIKAAGFDPVYAQKGLGIYPSSSTGEPFTAAYIESMEDVLANLSEDMAAEQKARATYEYLINLCDDKDVINVLLFLRQREVVHFNRFKELFDEYEKKGYNK